MSVELTGLSGRVAVVTGAGRMRSIGRPIAVELARAGCDVVLTGSGRPPDSYPEDEQRAHWRDVESVAEEIRALGRAALPLVCDVTSAEGVDELLRATIAEFGRVDVVVNNAAASRGPDRVPVTELDVDVWDRVMAVNLRGTFLVSRAVARRLVEQGDGGAIINISSIGGKLSGPLTAAYSASKAGVQSLTSSMAKELGAHRIRVNAVCPGITDTGRLDDWPPEARDSFIRDHLPLARVGTGQDVASTVVFLASEQGSWVTGQSWNVDGGQLTVR